MGDAKESKTKQNDAQFENLRGSLEDRESQADDHKTKNSIRKVYKSNRYGWKTLMKMTFMDKFLVPPTSFSILQNNIQARLLIDEIAKNNCPLNADYSFVFENCVSNVSGAFDDRNSQIVICSNNVDNEKQLQRTLMHQLIHVYDHCRAEVKWDSPKHLACSGIRAFHLTGECAFNKLWDENGIGTYIMADTYEKCLKEKTFDSIRAVRNFPDQVIGKAIDEVFAKCAADIAPFDRTKNNSP